MGTTTDTGRPAKGERSRLAILRAAANLATIDGLEGLSIGRLAERTGMSKSGLYAHFASKEDLQLQTVATAREIFAEQVLAPAASVDDALGRVRALYEGFLDHIAARVFPGGCFIAAVTAEFAAHPGAVRDSMRRAQDDWVQLIGGLLADAREDGTLDPGEDARLLRFELDAFVLRGNTDFVLRDDPGQIELARRAVTLRLDRARARRSAGRAGRPSPSGRG